MASVCASSKENSQMSVLKSSDTVIEERAGFWESFTFASPANTGNPSRKLPLAVTRRCNGFVSQPPPTSAGPPDVTVFVFLFLLFVLVWYEHHTNESHLAQGCVLRGVVRLTWVCISMHDTTTSLFTTQTRTPATSHE